MQNASAGLDDDCVAARGLADACGDPLFTLHVDPFRWNCYFPQYSYPYISTPTFVSNPTYDTWQLANSITSDPSAVP